jgi:methylation protein EvaC
VSITAIHKLLEGTKFYVADVKHYEIHGGSIALMIRRTDDRRPGKMNPEWYSKFEEKDLERRWRNMDVLKVKRVLELVALVRQLNSEGKKVCGFGASAKATVWINASALTENDIAYVCDSTPQKQGKLIPGTTIPIAPEARLMDADLAICFSWNFFPEIREKFKAFEEKGGKWIVPIPEVKIL